MGINYYRNILTEHKIKANIQKRNVRVIKNNLKMIISIGNKFS